MESLWEAGSRGVDVSLETRLNRVGVYPVASLVRDARGLVQSEVLRSGYCPEVAPR